MRSQLDRKENHGCDQGDPEARQTDSAFRLVSSRLVQRLLLWLAACLVLGPLAALASEPASFSALGGQYDRAMRPMLRQFCLDCHSMAVRLGELDLERFNSLSEVRRGTKVWVKVAEMLDKGEMPPKGAKQPRPEQRKQLRDWVERYLRLEALANAGDPGPVVLRRLNNAEYNWTIRDLTGVDLNPAKEFPADSAAGEGFTNTGNALVMSPALLKKYLDAGKEISRHAVLTPDGFRFSPQATQRDWTDEILAQIRALYREFVDQADLGVGSAVGNLNVHTNTRIGLAGRLPLEKYFAATLAERKALMAGEQAIRTVARRRGLNAKYLGLLWANLSGSIPSLLLDPLRARWRNANPQDAAALADDVTSWQKGLWAFGPVGLIGRQGGPSRWMEPMSPVVTQQELRFKIPALAAGEKEEEVVLSLVANDAGDGNQHDFLVWQKPRLVAKDRPDILLRDVRRMSQRGTVESAGPSTDVVPWGLDPGIFGKHPHGRAIDPDSLCVRAPSVITIRLPASLAEGYHLVTTAMLDKETGSLGSVQPEVVAGNAAPKSELLPSEVAITYSTVTQVFSDHRDVSFVRPILVAERSPLRDHILSGFEAHRNLFPAALCYTQIVPVDEVLTLALFYREDDHLVRLMLDDAQKARLDRLWEELHYVSQSPLMRVTALDLLMEAMAGNGVSDRSQYNALLPLRKPFTEDAEVFKKELIDSEPKHVDALVNFAAEAYRRLLSPAETDDLRGLYRRLREQELPHDEAFRLTLARVFVASPFLYRLETAPVGPATAAVSDWELASRLSYFLWSSQPDKELRTAATAGTLHRPAVLTRQARRMLTDARIRRLATEFAGQWLHIHDFASVEEKSKKHFPEFADLRGDMYEESILFFADLFQRDSSLLNLLNADHTFLNERLARFYGMQGVDGADWRRIDGVQKHGRGGILGLATTLAKQSGASRTSPILRGNWLTEVLLGERLPRPPKDVPQLPADETDTDGLTVRQLVTKHTSDPRCSGCHEKIDPFGYALEGYDAIGRRRDSDLAGRPIDTRTKLPDGTEINGFTDLRDYLLETRRDAIIRQFCRKLLGYAIGRELQLSDEPLLTGMQERLAKNNYRFSVAVEMIVRSRQFRQIRGRNTQYARWP